MSESKAQASAKAMDWAWRDFAFVMAALAVNLGVACWRGVSFGTGSDFGGVFGLSSALFTGLAFAGLLYAVVLQRDEVQTAREALYAARDELEIARGNQAALNKQLELQNDQTSRKTFEDTFFRMLAEIDNIYEGTSINKFYKYNNDGRGTIFNIDEMRGHAAFEKLEEELIQIINIPFADGGIEALYDHFYKSRRNSLGHYFRWIYYILDFIDRSQYIDRSFYAKLLRARLSDREITLIAYNGLGKFGSEMHPLIERYALLNNLDEDRPEIRPEILRNRYKKEAYQDGSS